MSSKNYLNKNPNNNFNQIPKPTSNETPINNANLKTIIQQKDQEIANLRQSQENLKAGNLEKINELKKLHEDQIKKNEEIIQQKEKEIIDLKKSQEDLMKKEDEQTQKITKLESKLSSSKKKLKKICKEKDAEIQNLRSNSSQSQVIQTFDDILRFRSCMLIFIHFIIYILINISRYQKMRIKILELRNQSQVIVNFW